jgi:hypothetical protein
MIRWIVGPGILPPCNTVLPFVASKLLDNKGRTYTLSHQGIHHWGDTGQGCCLKSQKDGQRWEITQDHSDQVSQKDPDSFHRVNKNSMENIFFLHFLPVGFSAYIQVTATSLSDDLDNVSSPPPPPPPPEPPLSPENPYCFILDKYILIVIFLCLKFNINFSKDNTVLV